MIVRIAALIAWGCLALAQHPLLRAGPVRPLYAGDKLVRIQYSAIPHTAKAQLIAGKFRHWARTQSYIDLQVNSTQLLALASLGCRWKVLIDDVAASIANTLESSPHADFASAADKLVAKDLFFQQYQSLESINSWLEYLADNYLHVISLEEIGRTFEDRPIYAVHFAAPHDSLPGHDTRKTIVISGGLHAREWILVLLALFLVNALLEAYIANPASKILQNLDFIIVPVFNPDGYAYTWSHDRLWRKNRQETTQHGCVGIDLDHAFDYHWLASDTDACNEDWPGSEPLEALEARAWDQYLKKINAEHTIYGYIDLHSYAQQVLYPYAYLCEQQPRDEETLLELAYGIAKTMRLAHGTFYDVSPACIDRDSDLVPFLGAGASLDYMYHNKAHLAFQFKLRDTGNHGYLVPPKYIEPVGQETFAGITYFCHFILAQY